MRRNTGPVGDPGSRQPALQRAHRTQLGVAIGEGDDDGLGLATFGLAQNQPHAALGRLEVGDIDRGEFGAPQCPGKADQQQRAIAQTDEVVGHGFEQPAQDLHGGRFLLAGMLAGAGGGALDPGQGLGHAGIIGRHRRAGGPVQIADGGAPQLEGFWREAAQPLAGEEGGDVGPACGSGLTPRCSHQAHHIRTAAL